MSEEPDWVLMARRRESFQKLSRLLLPARGQRLSAAECELLARIYQHEGGCTPHELSRESGMRKEAVSRCLRLLGEKGCLVRSRNPLDERSSIVGLSERGLEELREGLGAVLQPLYDLKRAMGPRFEELFLLVDEASESLRGGEAR